MTLGRQFTIDLVTFDLAGTTVATAIAFSLSIYSDCGTHQITMTK